MTRRMMAVVSELSMYQAHGIQLSADKEALEKTVMAASDKLAVRWHLLLLNNDHAIAPQIASHSLNKALQTCVL